MSLFDFILHTRAWSDEQRRVKANKGSASERCLLFASQNILWSWHEGHCPWPSYLLILTSEAAGASSCDTETPLALFVCCSGNALFLAECLTRPSYWLPPDLRSNSISFPPTWSLLLQHILGLVSHADTSFRISNFPRGFTCTNETVSLGPKNQVTLSANPSGNHGQCFSGHYSLTATQSDRDIQIPFLSEQTEWSVHEIPFILI